MIEMRKFKSSVFNIRLIFSLSSLFFFKSSSKSSDISSESITFNLSCYCYSILDNILWKSDVVSKIKKFLDRIKTLLNKKFILKASQAWFILINEKISAIFWLSESAHLSQMIENVNYNVSKFTKSQINSKNSSLLSSSLLLLSLLSKFL